MDEKKLLKLMQRYVANISISGSTLRNQGAEGVVDAARYFLANLPLNTLLKIQPLNYPEILNQWTEELRIQLPLGAQNWGTARKALNVFLVQVFLNQYLGKHYGLYEFGTVLETPLDSEATRILRHIAGRGRLPRWNGIINLTVEVSQHYQDFAAKYAGEIGLPRACLDILLWRAEE